MSSSVPQKQVTIKEKALILLKLIIIVEFKDKIRSFTKKSVIIFSKSIICNVDIDLLVLMQVFIRFMEL